MPPLKNQQHELFCLALMSGMSQQDAYIEAGYGATDAKACASRLSTKINIIKRRGELSALTTTDTIMPVKRRKERLSQLANEQIKQPVTAREVVMSIAELNKLDGAYPAEKIDIDFGKPFKELLDRLQGRREQITEGELDN